MEKAMEQICEFSEHWREKYSGHIYPNDPITDELILEYMEKFGTVERAADMMADYFLSQGLADVME